MCGAILERCPFNMLLKMAASKRVGARPEMKALRPTLDLTRSRSRIHINFVTTETQTEHDWLVCIQVQ